MSRNEQIAWAAGLFDGEGSVCSYKDESIRLRLTNTDFELCARFMAAVLVGNILTDRRLTKGGKIVYNWGAYSKHDVSHAMNLFWPYLSQRRKRRYLELLEKHPGVRQQRIRARLCRI